MTQTRISIIEIKGVNDYSMIVFYLLNLFMIDTIYLSNYIIVSIWSQSHYKPNKKKKRKRVVFLLKLISN